MKKTLAVIILFCLALSAFAQTSNSVSLDNDVYQLLELAEMRGLCDPLPSAKPYTERLVVSLLDQILENDKGILKASERKTIEVKRASFERNEGWDWQRGGYYLKEQTKKGTLMTLDANVSWDSLFSDSYTFPSKTNSFGTDNYGTVSFSGDMGEHFSWAISGSGVAVLAPHTILGENVNPYYEGYTGKDGEKIIQQVDNITIYSEPTSFFPFTFRKHWDSSVFTLNDLNSAGYKGWPQTLSFGYNIMSEMNVSLLEDKLTFRFGRMQREWGTSSSGNSLVLNSGARPFLGIESSYKPFSWLSFSALTGVLEYFNSAGIKTSAETFQNAYSLALVELNYKNYFHFDFGSSCVWPKRFELGYPFPLNSNFFYQNNIGDFDNLAITINMSGIWPKVGKAWFSLFVDEVDFSSGKNFFHLDRNMYAAQAGVEANIPWVPFSTLSVQYTKIEPYCYTHIRETTPWYGENWMYTAYMNNGVGLGYYLPPNSDEIKVRFDTILTSNAKVHAEYQLIRHGAEYGTKTVDGSSLLSELDPVDRGGAKAVLWKYFLHDGAYQWYNIIKVGGEYSLKGNNIPVTFYGDVGVVFSRFSDIDGAANQGYSSPYHFIDTDEYPSTISCVASIGVKIYR